MLASPQSRRRKRVIFQTQEGQANMIRSVFAFVLTGFWASSVAMAAPRQASLDAKADTKGEDDRVGRAGFEWPERVVAGNAIVGLLPLQLGMVGYLPKARFAIQYDRQLYKAHWAFVGLAVLLDRGTWSNFRLPNCGLSDSGGVTPEGSCQAGTVAGFDLYGGYIHKFYIQDSPWVVPYVKAGAGFGYWKYPKIGVSREQLRDDSWLVSLRPGGGFRLFLLDDLGIGLEVNLPIGLLVHGDWPLDSTKQKNVAFSLGIEILPAIEYRF